MALAFKVYESVSLEVLGTLAIIAGVGSKLRFTNRSMAGTGLLCVVITKKDGTSDTVTCSKAVTKAVRAALAAGASKVQCLAGIINNNIIEADNGGNYVSAPMGDGVELEEYTLAEIKKVAIDYEQLANASF